MPAAKSHCCAIRRFHCPTALYQSPIHLTGPHGAAMVCLLCRAQLLFGQFIFRIEWPLQLRMQQLRLHFVVHFTVAGSCSSLHLSNAVVVLSNLSSSRVKLRPPTSTAPIPTQYPCATNKTQQSTTQPQPQLPSRRGTPSWYSKVITLTSSVIAPDTQPNRQNEPFTTERGCHSVAQA